MGCSVTGYSLTGTPRSWNARSWAGSCVVTAPADASEFSCGDGGAPVPRRSVGPPAVSQRLARDRVALVRFGLSAGNTVVRDPCFGLRPVGELLCMCELALQVTDTASASTRAMRVSASRAPNWTRTGRIGSGSCCALGVGHFTFVRDGGKCTVRRGNVQRY
jgi:hypothetical protein